MVISDKCGDIKVTGGPGFDIVNPYFLDFDTMSDFVYY